MTTKTNFDEPLKPEWPMNVMVFKPTDDVKEIQARIKPSSDPYDDEKNSYVSDHHFSNKHYALLFAAGEYKNCDFEVGYYVGMAGLGNTAKGEGAVRFTGEKSGPFVPALNKHMPRTAGGSIAYTGSGLCLDTFWRSAENYSAEETQWAVSQAAPLRRVHIIKKLQFGDGGAYSSGGFLANAEVEGTCSFVANQQWFSRGVDFKGKVEGGAWSTVFSGCKGNTPRAGSPCCRGACVTVEETPVIRVEKPFIVMNSDGTYAMHVPRATTSTGAMLGAMEPEDVRPFSRVKVGKPFLPTGEDGNYAEHNDDTYNKLTPKDEKLTAELQQALDVGKDLLLCPGLFFLTKTLVVWHPNQVILGLGLATLVAPHDGSPCIRVQAKTSGVRIAGLVLEASKQDSAYQAGLKNSDGVSSLLEFGEPHVQETYKFSPNQPMGIRCDEDGLVKDVDGQAEQKGIRYGDTIMTVNGKAWDKIARERQKKIMYEGDAAEYEATFKVSVTDDTGESNNPGLISDVFARVGGSNLDRTVTTDIMVRVHSGNVVGDNLWLWRADHVKLDKKNGENPNDLNFPDYHQVRLWKDTQNGGKTEVNECVVKNALEVRGNDVHMYGLFCEHTIEHQMIWRGERGSVSFFQCELPYDVDRDFAEKKFTGYYVDENVENHIARGIGVYCNFQCYDVHAEMGMSLPSSDGIVLENPFTVFLNNKGGIKHVVRRGEEFYGAAAERGTMPGAVVARAGVAKQCAVCSRLFNFLLCCCRRRQQPEVSQDGRSMQLPLRASEGGSSNA